MQLSPEKRLANVQVGHLVLKAKEMGFLEKGEAALALQRLFPDLLETDGGLRAAVRDLLFAVDRSHARHTLNEHAALARLRDLVPPVEE